MSSILKTSVIVDDSAIVGGNTIDASNHNNPFEDTRDQLREGQASVSSADTHIKHLEDAIVGASGKVKATKLNPAANEQLEIDLDATGVPSGYSPVANGAGGWAWAAAGGGGAQPVDITVTAGENLSERDFVYLDESLGTWFKFDADDSPIRCGRLRGVVNEAGGITATNTGSVRLIGEVSGYSGLTAWEPVYAGQSDGVLTQTRPSPTSGSNQVAIVQVGIAVSATNIVVLPQQPIQYMKRDNNLADDATLTIEHHIDQMAHTRRAFAYIGSSEAGANLANYSNTNVDTDLNLRDRAPDTYTGDQCSGGTATASTDFGTAYTAPKAFDNDNGTRWLASDDSFPQWLEYDFGSSKTIRQYTMTCAANGNQGPADWELQYYDGANWQTADNQSGYTWTASQKRTFTVSNIFSANRWRIYFTLGNGIALSLEEVEMMEVATFVDGNDRLSQSFTIVSGADCGQVRLWLKKQGAPAGNLTVKIQTDNAGDPSGTTITNGTSATVSASSLSTSYGWISFTFSTPPSLSGGTTLHIVLETTDSFDETDFVVWGIDASSPSYANGESKSYDGSSWNAETADAAFEVVGVGTTFVEPAILGRWSGGTRDVAIRYDDGSGNNVNTRTTCKNVVGAAADITLVVEVP